MHDKLAEIIDVLFINRYYGWYEYRSAERQLQTSTKE
jgi:hypothetical protein